MDKQQRQFWVGGLSALLMVCLVYSKFVLSVSMIGLLLLAIWTQKKEFRIKLSFPYAVTTGIFFLVVLSIMNSGNYADWFHHVKMKLPFLVLPVAFFNLPSIRERHYNLMHYFFAGLLFMAALPPLVDYYVHFNDVQEAIGKGKSIRLPVQHVKFSLFYAFAIISLIVLYRERFIYKWIIERYIQLGVIAVGIIVLHVLAVRTGIVVFYGTLVILTVIEGLIKGRWKSMLVVLSLLVVIPTVSYYVVPSFHQKVDYMLWDIGKHSLGEGAGYSDSERLGSIKIGLEIFKEKPFFGTGIGDLKDEVADLYQAKFGPEKQVLYPHNQYLFVAAGMGLIGLLLFLMALAYPFFFFIRKIHPLFLSLGIVSFMVFCIDNLLERSFGVGFYVFFLCIGISYLSSRYRV